MKFLRVVLGGGVIWKIRVVLVAFLLLNIVAVYSVMTPTLNPVIDRVTDWDDFYPPALCASCLMIIWRLFYPNVGGLWRALFLFALVSFVRLADFTQNFLFDEGAIAAFSTYAIGSIGWASILLFTFSTYVLEEELVKKLRFVRNDQEIIG